MKKFKGEEEMGAKKGVDTLALNRYWKLIKEELPKDWYFSSFMHTFGDARKAIIEVASTGRAGGFRGQSIWEDNHTYNSSKHDAIIMKDLRFHNDLKQRFPTLDVMFSPFCEHTIKGDTLKRLMDKVKAEARDVGIVNSYWTGDSIKDGSVINEVHGNGSKVPSGRYNFSYDGQSATGQDNEADKEKYKDANIFWFWECWMNLKYKDEDKTPRDKRTYRPKAIHFDSIVALSRDRGVVSLSTKYISKPMSEDVGDSKSNKLVFVSPNKVKEIQFVATNSNQVIDTARYYSAFSGGGYRYYSTMAGFQIADKALRVSGSRLTRVFEGGKQIGIINAGFRAGKMR